jgi:hypothetical protein
VESAYDIDTREVIACDEAFFAALLAADPDLLGTILAGDFALADQLPVHRGDQAGHVQ